MKAWKKPDTVICNEWCWNSLAKRSDIVLPCTTPLEREDLAITPRDPYIIKMSKLTEPYGDSRDDFDIFSGIAKLMGKLEHFTDLVFYVESEQETIQLVEMAKKHDVCLIPYGGGTNVTNALRPPKEETRMVVTVDTRRMNRVESIDEEN